ncbi:hypothetical protein RUM43_008745 [Polyplax serrata]|uniref:Uncharacterized protein n=1 Tax=Polyplax serrata TaxID=468196 RepID=A0AAN8RTZ4_POLSC
MKGKANDWRNYKETIKEEVDVQGEPPVGIYKDKYEWAGSQEAGDCSLLIKHVTIDFDDGEWECQVTASEFTAQDALTSTPVRLVVRAKNGNGNCPKEIIKRKESDVGDEIMRLKKDNYYSPSDNSRR